MKEIVRNAVRTLRRTVPGVSTDQLIKPSRDMQCRSSCVGEAERFISRLP